MNPSFVAKLYYMDILVKVTSKLQFFISAQNWSSIIQWPLTNYGGQGETQTNKK